MSDFMSGILFGLIAGIIIGINISALLFSSFSKKNYVDNPKSIFKNKF